MINMKVLLKVQSILKNCYVHLIIRNVKQIWRLWGLIIFYSLLNKKGKCECKSSWAAHKYIF